MDENNLDEAQKADVSQNDVESPATENLTEGAIETPQSEVEPDNSNEAESEVEPTGEIDEEAATDEVSETKSRKTADSRIRELNAEKKAAEARADSLADQMRRLTSNRPTFEYEPPQSDQTEITVDELMRRQKALVDIELARERNINRVNQEATEATNAYPELNPDSDVFDPDLSESISQAVLAKVQADPTSDVKGFVTKLMKPYKQSLEKQAQGQRETITKQVSQQAVRPTQVREQEKPFAELSIEEMEKQLERHYR